MGSPGCRSPISPCRDRPGCRAQELDPHHFPSPRACETLRSGKDGRESSVLRWTGKAIAAWFTPRAVLIAENLCLRQQLLVLERRTLRPRLPDPDRRFWILACRWVPRWREFLALVHSAGHRAPLASTGMDGLLAVAIPACITDAGSRCPWLLISPVWLTILSHSLVPTCSGGTFQTEIAGRT